MSGLWGLIEQDMAAAAQCVNEMAELRRRQAEAEREYRMAKAEKMLALRSEGYPATLIPDLAKGDERISLLAFQRDCAEGLVDANREAELLCKKRIDAMREQLSREWSQSGWRE